MLEKANGKNNWHYNPKLKKYASENSELVRIDISNHIKWKLVNKKSIEEY